MTKTIDPHIGLLLTFNLYEYPRKKINNFSTDHLNFFYKKILKQKPRGQLPNRFYMNIEINSDYESVYIPKRKKLLLVKRRMVVTSFLQTIEKLFYIIQRLKKFFAFCQ